MSNEFKYGIEVYEDYAIIKGKLTSDVLLTLIKISENEGFKYMVPHYQEVGFKLVREIEI